VTKLWKKTVLVKQFVVQLDESTDISNEYELVAFVRVPDKVEIVEYILFCKSLKGNATGRAVFEVINDFFNEQKIKWQWCEDIRTDGRAAVTGRLSGLVSCVKKENNSLIFNHCIIHRQALASKKLNPILHETITNAVKVINFIKSRPLNTRMFHQLCAQMDSEHTGLLFHSEIRLLSRGTVLKRLFELRHEVYLFLKSMTPLSSHFKDEAWLCWFAYLTDIFSKLNDLSLNLQGNGNNMFSLEDKSARLLYETAYVARKVKSGNLAAFPTMLDFLDEMIGTSHLLELNPILSNTWRICHSNSCHITHS
jgi:hypothetical protein